MIRNVHFEQTPDRLKVVLPIKRKWVWFILFTVLMILWVIGLIWAVVFIIRDVAFSGERFAFTFTVMLLVWLYIWYRLGKLLWHQWQYYTADREILFLEKERLMIRRPVSLLGITDAYDMNHVSPFFYSDEQQCPGFEYGHRRVYFGCDLSQAEGNQLVKAINKLYFSRDDENDY